MSTKKEYGKFDIVDFSDKYVENTLCYHII